MLIIQTFVVKFIYSEKAIKFYKIFTLLLSYVVPVKSKVKISQNVAAFSEYVNFNKMQKILVPNISMHFYCFGYTRVCEVAVAESQTPSLVYLIGIHHVWNIETDMHDGCKIRLDCYYPWSHFSNVDNKLVCWLSIAKKTLLEKNSFVT